jgi:hypothetical protein
MAAPLDRTWYNTLVDDDGSGNIGTVWNKAAVDALLDSVDARLAGVVDGAGALSVNEFAVFADPDTIKGGTGLVTLGSGNIVRDTLPGADNAAITISGAGAVDANRGASIYIAGNQYGAPGFVSITSGVGGAVSINRGNIPSVQFLSDGAMKLLDGQVLFPATQRASADPNTLDDYREFSWTPKWTATGGATGIVYASQVGYGIKVGRHVKAWAVLGVTSPGTMAGAVALWGLPYFASSGGGAVGAVTVAAFSGAGIPFSMVSGFVTPSVDWADLTYLPAGGGTALLSMPAAMIIAGTTIYCEVSYLAAQ